MSVIRMIISMRLLLPSDTVFLPPGESPLSCRSNCGTQAPCHHIRAGRFYRGAFVGIRGRRPEPHVAFPLA